MFGFSGQGSPLPLLLDDELSVSVMVHPIVETYLGQMGGPRSVAGLAVELSGSLNLLWGGCWFGSPWFGLPLGCATFAFTLQNLVLVSLVPLSFSLFRQVWILVGHTELNWFLSREFVYIYRFVLQSQFSVQGWRGWREPGTHGGDPLDPPPAHQTSHLTLT